MFSLGKRKTFRAVPPSKRAELNGPYRRVHFGEGGDYPKFGFPQGSYAVMISFCRRLNSGRRLIVATNYFSKMRLKLGEMFVSGVISVINESRLLMNLCQNGEEGI